MRIVSRDWLLNRELNDVSPEIEPWWDLSQAAQAIAIMQIRANS